MRLPFPEHISLLYAGCFATLLCTAQFLQGTSLLFSLCCFGFILIAVLAFNLAGGFAHPSGAYVFFYAFSAVTLGLIWKVVLGEPADSNLKHPLLTIEAHLGGVTAMLGAVFLSRKVTKRRAILADMITDANLLPASLGCMVVGISLSVVLLVVPFEGGTILSALNQLNHFLEISIILGVIYQIRKSGGTSSMNLPVLISMVAAFVFGILVFSKQGMFTPFVCWIMAAASQRYRISFFQAVSFVLFAVFTVYYLVPYSQYGRNVQTDSRLENVNISIDLLSDLGKVRQEYEQSAEVFLEGRVTGYFNTVQPLADRMVMIPVDDAIIGVTEEKGPFGLAPVILQFGNLIPHVLWPDKPAYNFGNVYAHEIGMVAPDDTTTGVSFSPIGEAWRVGRWTGIFLIAPVLWIMLFTLYDSLCGDVRKYPWGLLAIVLLAHIAPDGELGGIIYMLWYGAIGIAFVAVVASYLMPVFGSLFAGRQQTGLRRIAPVRSIPRRLPAVQPSRTSNP